MRSFLLLLAQLLVVLLVIDRFRIESASFLHLSVLTVAGFAIHYFLPFRHRLPFFALLSGAAIAHILGPVGGAWTLGLGLGLIGIAHLPIPMPVRIAILLAIGAAAAVFRFGIGEVPWSPAIWPILGSLFVFRMINYLYDLSHKSGPKRISETLAYFFMLPNICFPLFPVVDFTKFTRNYYDEERHKIYGTGVQWIWRGVLQLILYRLVYYHLTIDSLAVHNLADLVVYMFSTFMLYVRISGHFHIIIGILHLFGLNLPESHHRYFFAASYTDFWRRINIYWKDFMMKIFYYPAYFKLRRFGETTSLIGATLWTFLLTWILHTVQWFWIRGSLFIEANDIAFWSIFALLVLGNALYETRKGRKRTLTKRARTFGEGLGLALRTLGVFASICALWSLWTAESIPDWGLLCTAATVMPPWEASRWVLVLSGLALAAGVALYGVWKGWGTGIEVFSPKRAATSILVGGTALVLLTTTPVIGALGKGGELVESLRSTHLSRRDAEQFQRGYYENLLAVSKFNSELNRIYEKMPSNFVRSLDVLGLSRATGDYQDYEMVPQKEGRFYGAMVTTNQWGMRDRDYSLERPDDVVRVALIGASFAMGSGVEADSVFEALIEERLNRENDRTRHQRYEVLNFAVAGYSPLHSLMQLEKNVFKFQPDVVVFVAHSNDLERSARQCARLALKGVTPPDPFLSDLAERAKVRPPMGPNESMRRMRPHDAELLSWIYRRIAGQCRAREIVPVFVYLPGVTEAAETWRAPDRARVLELGRSAGFEFIDLTGVFDGRPPESLWILENDPHPNGKGNVLTADRLYPQLREVILRTVGPRPRID
ncbi:MAG: hypothetical protein IT349_21950 [Candidatus Eisenbacteria bacterium]|nr:hypothetical protein [Candidatus Eisenbacteria bacterium]